MLDYIIQRSDRVSVARFNGDKTILDPSRAVFSCVDEGSESEIKMLRLESSKVGGKK